MKIKTKKAFGEKHQLRRQQRLVNATARADYAIERSRATREEDKKRAKEFLESKAWWQRIQALRLDDPCEFYEQRVWHPAVFVQPVESAEETECWRVRDAQGKRLRAFHIRAPGDQEAWPGLPPTPDMEQRRKHREMRMARMGVPIPVRPDVVQDPDQDPKAVAAAEAGHSTSGATWRDQSARLSLVKVYANAACLAAEAFGDKTAENAAHVAWGDADEALRRLTEDHLPEIEADYGEVSAAFEGERAAECRSQVADTDDAIAKTFADLDRMTLQGREAS